MKCYIYLIHFSNVEHFFQGADHEFAPYREREQSSDCIDYHERSIDAMISRDQPMNLNSSERNYTDALAEAAENKLESARMDSHVDNYDKQGSISLHSCMQSMVPEPFQPKSDRQTPGSNNMPGGRQPQMSLKYTSETRHGRNDPAGEVV